MTISYRSLVGLEALLAAVVDLVEAVGGRGAIRNPSGVQLWSLVLDNIERYVALIEQGRSSDDPVPALKGANLLTTVNKGIGDAEQEPADHILGELAFEVARRAMDAARSLRGDAGVVPSQDTPATVYCARSMKLNERYRTFSYGPPASAVDMNRFVERYENVPPGYLAIVREVTGLVLLWQQRGELRLWGPDEAIGMDDAYGVSANIPGAVAIGDNGGGALIVHGAGTDGLALYLVETGSLFLDEDAPKIARDLTALLELGEGAELVCRSDPIDPDTLGPPIFYGKDHD